MNTDNYLFGKEPAEAKRLDLLNEIFSKYTKNFVSIHLSNKQGNLLEVGCGNGVMLDWLARQTFISSATGIDINESALKLAAQYNSPNTTFEVLSAYDLDQLSEHYDFIYQRFVLIHLTNPKAALKAIYNQLKPGGIFICEAAIHSHCFSDPTSKSYNRFIKLAMQMFASQGKDGDIGKHIISYAGEIGFKRIASELHQPLLTTATEKKLMLLGLRNAKANFLQENLITEDEFSQIESDMQAEINDEHCLWAAPTLCQFLLQRA